MSEGKKTSSAGVVYKTFEAYQERQQKILASVLEEQKAVLAQYENVTEAFTAVLRSTFPTLRDLPLELMTQASRLSSTGIERDYAHLVATLIKNDANNRQQFAEKEAEFGNLAQIKQLQNQSAEALNVVQTEYNQLLDDRQKLQRRKQIIEKELGPITEYEAQIGVQFTNQMATIYGERSFMKWATDPDWRAARSALVAYQERGGRDIERSKKTLDGLIEDIKGVEGNKSQAVNKVHSLEAQVGSLSTTVEYMERLERQYRGDDAIHAEVCANFADLLQYEDVASLLGKNLPPEQATPLMVATLKFRNLHVLYDNLEQLRVQAEAALGQFTTPVKKLKNLAKKSSYKDIEIDLDAVDSNFKQFNSAASSALAKSSAVRGVVSNYQPSSSAVYSNDSSGDPYLAMKIIFFQMWMQSASSNPIVDGSQDMGASSPTLDGNTVVQTSDIGSADFSQVVQGIGSLDLGSAFGDVMNIPSLTIDAGGSLGGLSPSFSDGSSDGGGGGYSSSYDGGGSYGGGYSDGGSCGGGSDGGGGCISLDIANDIGFEPKKRRGRNSNDLGGFDLR